MKEKYPKDLYKDIFSSEGQKRSMTEKEKKVENFLKENKDWWKSDNPMVEFYHKLYDREFRRATVSNVLSSFPPEHPIRLAEDYLKSLSKKDETIEGYDCLPMDEPILLKDTLRLLKQAHSRRTNEGLFITF